MIKLNKNIIREEIRRKREKLSIDVIREKSNIIANKLISLDMIKESSCIMTYISIKNEVDTSIIISKLKNMGKNIVIPYFINNQEIGASLINDIDNDLVIGNYNTFVPKSIIKIDNIDVVIVPGVAFDYNGNRIGFGGGYYDRFLSKPINRKAFKIGICYDFQLVDNISNEKHDISIDFLVTEKRILNVTK